MYFLIQNITGRIVHDFAFELQRSKEFYDNSARKPTALAGEYVKTGEALNREPGKLFCR